MHPVDWIIVVLFCLASLCVGLVLSKKASSGLEAYFVSGRGLAWWLAGTSMAATAFSSDTPLLVTGIIRSKGIWGNWEIWSLSISTMFAVFFFSKLWKRSGVMTEVEFVETRYSGRPAAFLRGFKAIYWGVLYNTFVMGAWPMTGLVKVMQETTPWGKLEVIVFCMTLTVTYCMLSGYWGVVLTDFLQFIIATIGAIALAVFAVQAAGGMPGMVAALESSHKLDFIPPASGHTPAAFLESPFGWFLGLILVQWWAWKNTDGGGIIVQRIASCKDETHSLLAVLWFNIAQYAVRMWPWILTALASLVLLPELADHERAYPRLVTQLMPVGFKGLMIASFFAAFMSTMSTHLNWGASYFINDFYKRFLKKNASDTHCINAARILTFLLACGATVVAFFTESISQVFTFVLNLTAAIGPVYLLRWFWWRINAWSEITAMAVSFPVIVLRPHIMHALGLPDALLIKLLFMVAVSALFWIPATFLTQPVQEKTLNAFFNKVSPPGFWRGKEKDRISWMPELRMWLVSTGALLATATGPLKWILGDVFFGCGLTLTAVLLWSTLYIMLRAKETTHSS